MVTRDEQWVVHFPEWYDGRGEWEAESKGWLQGVEVEFHGRRHSFFFYDPVRIVQDLESEVEQGRPLLAEPGLVLVPEVTRSAIITAVGHLVRNGYFERLDTKDLSTTSR